MFHRAVGFTETVCGNYGPNEGRTPFPEKVTCVTCRRKQGIQEVKEPAVGLQFAYRWEPHSDPTGYYPSATAYQRGLIVELGEAGWEFVGFIGHWGPDDGKTMLFKRAVG